MKYLLWLYVANISNRFRWFGMTVFRICVVLLGGLHLLLATHNRPMYYDSIQHYINLTWIYAVLSLLLMFLPSQKYIFSILSIYKKDRFIRENIIAKVLRLVKLIVKHDFFDMSYSKGLYNKLVTAKRIKWLCIALYIYDVYKAYRRAVGDLLTLLVLYFGFVCATWLYVKLTGVNLYYYPSISWSIGWVIALSSFLILKVIFLPSFSTIKSVIIKLVISMVLHKFGLVKAGYKLDEKIDSYQPKNEGVNNA